MVDPLAINDAANNGQTSNWEGTFTLGSFTTTAVLSINPAFTQATAGFQTSDVVAGKLGSIVISGVEPTPSQSSDLASFGVGFQSAVTGSAATTFTVNSVTDHVSNSALAGAFFYIGLAG